MRNLPVLPLRGFSAQAIKLLPEKKKIASVISNLTLKFKERRMAKNVHENSILIVHPFSLFKLQNVCYVNPVHLDVCFKNDLDRSLLGSCRNVADFIVTSSQNMKVEKDFDPDEMLRNHPSLKKIILLTQTQNSQESNSLIFRAFKHSCREVMDFPGCAYSFEAGPKSWINLYASLPGATPLVLAYSIFKLSGDKNILDLENERKYVSSLSLLESNFSIQKICENLDLKQRYFLEYDDFENGVRGKWEFHVLSNYS